MPIKSLLVAAALAALASAAQAQDPAATPGIDKRQEAQQKRIDQGLASGQLTGKEATRLERHQGRIRKMESAAKADGTVTQNERVRIHHAQDRESRHIRHEKHDLQRVN